MYVRARMYRWEAHRSCAVCVPGVNFQSLPGKIRAVCARGGHTHPELARYKRAYVCGGVGGVGW